MDNQDNPGASSSVRGVISLLGYALDSSFVDQGGPALMMINHDQSRLVNGTLVVGSFTISIPNVGGITQFGTDPLAARARNQGFIEGQDLEYIRLSGPSPYKGFNEACLDVKHLRTIRNFIERNSL